MAPQRRYSREHTWAERQGDALLVGLTAYAIDRLGELVHLRIDVAPDQLLAPGEVIGSLESDRDVVDLHTPVGGRVLAIHEDLARDPARLHDDCYQEGWLVRLATGESSEFSGLLDAAAYHEFLKVRTAGF